MQKDSAATLSQNPPSNSHTNIHSTRLLHYYSDSKEYRGVFCEKCINHKNGCASNCAIQEKHIQKWLKTKAGRITFFANEHDVNDNHKKNGKQKRNFYIMLKNENAPPSLCFQFSLEKKEDIQFPTYALQATLTPMLNFFLSDEIRTSESPDFAFPHHIKQISPNPMSSQAENAFKINGILEKIAQLMDVEFCCFWHDENSIDPAKLILAESNQHQPKYIGHIGFHPQTTIDHNTQNKIRRHIAAIKSPTELTFPFAAKSHGSYTMTYPNGKCIGAMIAINKRTPEHDEDKQAILQVIDKSIIKIISTQLQSFLLVNQMKSYWEPYQMIVETIPEPMMLCSKFGKITYMNAGAKNMFGNIEGASIASAYFSDSTSSNRDKTKEIKEKLLENKGILSHYVTNLRNKDGEAVYASLSACERRDHLGNFIGTVGIATDLSRLKALLDIGQTLPGARDVENLLDRVCEFGLKLPLAIRVYFKLYNKKNNTLQFKSLKSKLKNDSAPVSETHANEGFTGHAFRTQKALKTDDVLSDPEIKWNGLFDKVRSKIVIPITYTDEESKEDKRLGVFTVDSDQVAAFTTSDLYFFEILSSQAAVALTNAELIETKNAVIRRLKAIERVQKTTLTDKMDRNFVLNSLLDAVTEDLGFHLATISMVDKNRETITTVMGRNVDGRFFSYATHSLDSKDIQAWVVRHGKAEYLDGYDDRLDAYIYKKFDHDQLVRMIIPISMRSEVIGTLEVGYRKDLRDEITEKEKDTLNSITRQTGLALEHVKLHQSLKEQVIEQKHLQDQLDALNEASIKLLNSTHEQEAVNYIFQSLSSIGFKKGMLSFVNREKRVLEAVYAHGENWEQIRSEACYDLDDKNICTSALRSKEAVFVNNCVKNPRCDKKLIQKAKISAQYVIPLIAKDDLIGTLQIDLTDKKELLSADESLIHRRMKVLETFARQSAIAIRNIRGRMVIDQLETTIAETAHEFRNPLHNIMTQIGGLRDQLQEAGSSADITQYLKMIEEEIYRAKRQVDNSLFLSEQTRSGVGYDFQEIRIYDLIQTCVDNYKLRALERGIRIIVRDNVKHLPKIKLDPYKIEQVISNLIENAVKYSFYHELIKISGGDDGSNFHITICDRGLGIPSEDFSKIFQGFSRSKTTDPIRYISGTGIGLKICKEFIEMHGGEIVVKSTPATRNQQKIEDFMDYITEFTISLPKVRKETKK